MSSRQVQESVLYPEREGLARVSSLRSDLLHQQDLLRQPKDRTNQSRSSASGQRVEEEGKLDTNTEKGEREVLSLSLGREAADLQQRTVRCVPVDGRVRRCDQQV